jgi:hypothetical protein
MVYRNAASKKLTLIAWNPTAKPKSVQFFAGNQLLGNVSVSARSMASTTVVDQR